ncbi:hypothetical protein FLJC2902T_13130 [Flavobacterium limnosediminis JC2902]|uniref:Rad50/SbcC-type AAA domain-containing protein n=1 Tax=Flavobacterium limnosediminis JC2902 TaxID=1341181 RepID=V6SRB6_9FLAO|nr:hypothetical protein [Flavobacterium limnosediminis]ESU28722.1 hypothetical protein FLJC2902T_13130 [Flavobacterium limnosediminis JC2902]
MKIKRVEIQAFRAYDKVENGTFDFKRNEDGEYADFISLYAPNGFGKTSFYDAVEYSYTKNIDRFLKKDKLNQESAKSEKNINNADKQFILRNRYSDSSLSSYVKLLTSNSDTSIVRDIPLPRKGTADFKFDEKETENKYFREVILSQDWISGFLKEEKPEDRYKIFIEYFGDTELDKYYNVLSQLISLNDKEIKNLTSNLKGIQLELKFEGDKDVLFKVNEKINSLNENVKFFNIIDSQSSETDILNLTNDISERLNNIEFEITKNQNVISELDSLIIGTDDFVSFKQFTENIKNLNKSIERQSLLVSFKKKFDDLARKRTERNSIQDYAKRLTSEKERKEKILNLFGKYNEVENLRKNKDKEIKVAILSQESLNKEMSSQKIRQSELEIQISTSQSQINDINKIVTDLPEIKERILNTESSVLELKKNLEVKKVDLSKKSNLIKPTEDYINDLKSALSNLSNDIYPSEFDINFVKYSELLKKIDDLKSKLNEENGNLLLIKNEIIEQEKFQAELDNFISKGLSIINDQKTDSCPLCNHDYESYNILADKVANNKLLSQRTNQLLNRRNEVENIINNISEEQKKIIGKLTETIKKDISDSELKLHDFKIQALDIRKSITELENEIDKESNTLSNHRNLISNKSVEEYGEWAKDHLKKLSADFKSYQLDLTSINDKLKTNQEQYKIISQKIELFAKDKKLFEDNNALNEVRGFFLENYPNLEIDSKYINIDLKSLSDSLKEYSIKLDELKGDIKVNENDLISISEDSVKKELEELSNSIMTLSRVIENYKSHSDKYIDLNVNEIKEEVFLDKINDIKKSKEDKLSDYQNERRELSLLYQLKDNVLPYLKFEGSKRKESEIKIRIKLLKDKVGKSLSEEIKKVSEHIEKQIKSFFYEELINDLYKRIDPHPEYKKVKFIPDFKDSKPKLNVCVYKNNEESDFIIPNLYFSQAQLNILSLCIFLAKALNAKDDRDNAIDCIFVDDPIQSMDSINILSTIDLLRSIVVNQKKQIILSTHDENFHNLLKKKIPSDLFKSKFMELETFGKVRG